MHNSDFANMLNTAFPAAPKRYDERIFRTAASLRARDAKRSKRKGIAVRVGVGTAAALAALLAALGCAFSVRPALAAEIPFVNDVVYTLAPSVQAGRQKTEEIDALASDAVKAMLQNDREALDRLFYRPEALTDESTPVLALGYLRYCALTYEWIDSGIVSGSTSVSVREAEGTQKAFRYEIRASILVTGKGGERFSEPFIVRILENTHGMFLEDLELLSEPYSDYAERFRSDRLIGGTSAETIELNNMYFAYLTLHKDAETARSVKVGYLNRLEEQIASADAPETEKTRAAAIVQEEIDRLVDVEPEMLSYEALAAELMYRYHLGRATGEVSDFFDLVERNEQTDLFLYDAKLAADRVRLGQLAPVDSVEKGTAEIVRTVSETEEAVTLELLVHTEIRQGITKSGAEQIFLTFRKDTGMVIGYEPAVGDGVYQYQLKPLADLYRKQGMSWQEADEAAYRALLTEIETYLKEH